MIAIRSPGTENAGHLAATGAQPMESVDAGA